MSQARPLAPDADAEREVDLRTLWARLADRWWLPGRGSRRRGRDRRSRLRRRRADVEGEDTALSRAAVHDLGRRPDPEPRHEPANGQRDHPLRVRAQARRVGERAARRPAEGSHHLAGGDRGRADTEPDAARRDLGRRAGSGQGREGVRRPRQFRDRRGVDVRQPEDRAPPAPDPVEPGRAEGHRHPRHGCHPAAPVARRQQGDLADGQADRDRRR